MAQESSTVPTQLTEPDNLHAAPGPETPVPATETETTSSDVPAKRKRDNRRPPDIDTTGGPPPGMSKNQWKKHLRSEKAQSQKKERRTAEKQRKKANKRARYQEMQAKIEAGEMEPPESKHQKPTPPKRPLDVGIIIDLGFDNLMEDRVCSQLWDWMRSKVQFGFDVQVADNSVWQERRSMCLQLGHLYSTQRKSRRPFKYLYVVGEGDHPGSTYIHSSAPEPEAEGHEPQSLLDTAFGKHMENNWTAMWRRWNSLSILPQGGIEGLIAPETTEGNVPTLSPPELQFLEPSDPSASKKMDTAEAQHIKTHRWNKDDLIYLTADSDETAETLEEGKTYIVGGIVDHNRYKNLCANKARAMGIRTAKLPINSHTLCLADGAELASRKVLTVNQVFDILSGWAETQDWPSALARAFPVRKLREVVLPSDRSASNKSLSQEPEPRQDLDDEVNDEAAEAAVMEQAAADTGSDDESGSDDA